jgi:DNA-binding transcriptional LysR family regulator
MDKLLAMKVFIRVVDVGSFTKAADALDMPKPTVTRLIQGLETGLKTQLLHRTTRRMTVTPEGAAYYDRATRLLGEFDELETGMLDAKAAPRGRLRVDVPASLGMSIIIPALPDFHARYPGIQLHLGVSDRPVDLVAESVDCVVRGGEVANQALVARRIGDAHLIMCATPGYLETHGIPLHPRDLERSHLLVRYTLPRTGQLKPIELSKDGNTFEVQGQHMISLSDSNAYVAAGLSGLGVMHALTYLVHDLVRGGALVPVLSDWVSPPRPLYIVYPPSRHLSAKLIVFVDWISELFASHDMVQIHRPSTRTTQLHAPSAWQKSLST